MAEMEKSNSFISMEHDMLKFWEENDCYQKRKEKNQGNERFRFIDGPITANNPMGIHHAWGRTLKDTFIRYKYMRGYDCRCQNGFDSQGLWVEVGVEKDLGFESKKDIEDYGIDKFTTKCVERVKQYSSVITEQSRDSVSGCSGITHTTPTQTLISQASGTSSRPATTTAGSRENTSLCLGVPVAAHHFQSTK